MATQNVGQTLIPISEVLDMIGALCADCQAKVRASIVSGKGTAHSRTALRGIFAQVCAETNTDPNDVLYGGNHRSLVEVRAKVARQAHAAGFSYPEIGAVLNRHHTSVMNLVTPRKK